MVALSEALTAALERRGVDRPTARLATDVGGAVRRRATERRLADENADFAAELDGSPADRQRLIPPGPVAPWPAGPGGNQGVSSGAR
jgi:hypothetical protein